MNGKYTFGYSSPSRRSLIKPSEKWFRYLTRAAPARPVFFGRQSSSALKTRLSNLPKLVTTATPSSPGAYKRHMAADSYSDSIQHDTATDTQRARSVNLFTSNP